MCKGDGLSGSQVRRNAGVIQVGGALVIDENHDNVSGLGSLGDGHNLKAVLGGLVPGISLAQADNDVAAGVAQIHCVRMALRAVADDSDLLAIQNRQVTVLLIIHFCHS